MYELEFHGAARTVTGSCHILRINGKTILLDCGLFQGRRSEAWERNTSFPFIPEQIDAVVLSHAHIDHSGNIPNLVKQGFHGPVICTHATRDLANIMLMDSAFIQQKDVEFVNKIRSRKGETPVEPLYDPEDVIKALSLFQTIGYHRPARVVDGVEATFYDAGHILGSALVALELTDGVSKQRLCFTGDLGRSNRPILRNPEFTGDVDVLITESTYGGRLHGDEDTALDAIEDVVKRTVARNGKIIVPAFSVGRTQELVYDMRRLVEAGRMPDVPIYVDSPLSVSATQIFRMHPECFDADMRELILSRKDPFGFERLRYIMSVSESKALNNVRGPIIIISASGMAEGGRVLHHLRNNIENERNTIMITGYCAEHTLGRKLVEKEPVVSIFGEKHELKAEVAVLNMLSAHADRNELLVYHGQYDRERLAQVFIVHGDYDQQEKLGEAMTNELGISRIAIPEAGEKFEL